MIHRRQLLASAAAALLAAPFASLLAPPWGGRARAGTPRFADRLIVFYTPNGTIHRFWRPIAGAGGPTDFSFAPGSILESLAPRRQQLLVCDGIDFAGVQDHAFGMEAMLTGSGAAMHVGAGASVDQFVAAKLGGATRLRSIELGVQTSVEGGNNRTRMCYSAPGAFVTPEDDPRAAWVRLFGGLVGGKDAAARLLARRRSMLDVASAELRALRGRVGAAEQVKLDQHLDALRATEQALGAPALECAPPPQPAAQDVYDNDRYRAIGQAQLDVLVAALACGATRVASLQWSLARGGPLLSFAPVAAPAALHTLSHSDDSDVTGVDAFVRCQRWLATQFGYLLERLEATPDVVRGGSLLDSSAVLWISEIGDARLHDCKSVPVVIAGGANGYFKLGQHLRFGGVPHQQLLTTMCRASGVDVDRFGDDARGQGTLAGVTA